MDAHSISANVSKTKHVIMQSITSENWDERKITIQTIGSENEPGGFIAGICKDQSHKQGNSTISGVSRSVKKLLKMETIWLSMAKKIWQLPPSCPTALMQSKLEWALPSLKTAHWSGDIIRTCFLRLSRSYYIASEESFGNISLGTRMRTQIRIGKGGETMLTQPANPPVAICAPLKPWWHKYRKSLTRDNIILLQDVLDPVTGQFRNFEDKYGGKRWYRALVDTGKRTSEIDMNTLILRTRPIGDRHTMHWGENSTLCYCHYFKSSSRTATLTTGMIHLSLHCSGEDSPLLIFLYLLVNNSPTKHTISLRVQTKNLTNFKNIWNDEDQYRTTGWTSTSMGGS